MTSQSPRIYTYKITFEEVPYYYYGIHEEKVYDEEYWGSPITNKWCWELYTPKKQILETFSSRKDAGEVERRLIKPVYNTDKWCLNEKCGGTFSLDVCSKAGKIGGNRTYELGIGLHSIPIEKRKENGSKGGNRTYELRIGAFEIPPEERRKISQLGNKTNKINGTGIYSITKEQQIEYGKNWGKVGSKKTNSQKWMCLETGYITTSGPLTAYQRARSIDTSKRKRIE